MTPAEKLRAFNIEFEKKVFELAPNIFLAVGFAASNVGMIVGDDGVTIIDTTESTKAAESILGVFREITDKPIKTIVYTHSHRDHISGAKVFAEDREVEIIAHHAFQSDLLGADDRPGPHAALLQRTARQFGIGLEGQTERINIGLGPADRPIEGLGAGHLTPNNLITADGVSLTRGGVELHLTFAPGECPDTLAVWLPSSRVLFSADNYYAGFPNLYAIRGTPYRDFGIWADTLAHLSEFDANVLAPGHTRPVFGAHEVRVRLRDYEAAIRHIISETAAGLNAGFTPDELAQRITLPTSLADKPFLQEVYGTVAWSVRAYAAGTLGWFDGDPASLNPLSPHEEATRIVALAGGVENVLATAQRALGDGDTQWALDLATKVMRIEPLNADAKTIRISALRARADETSNACARNTYLSQAKQEEAG